VGLVGKILNRLVIALVGFPSNAIVVVEIEQSMRVLLLPTSLRSSVWIVRLLRLPSVSLQPSLATPWFSTRLDGLSHDIFSCLPVSVLPAQCARRRTNRFHFPLPYSLRGKGLLYYCTSSRLHETTGLYSGSLVSDVFGALV
jgi:hypothetical protein